MTVKKILIYRLGSLGDTLVALPAFHLIARTFPNAERRVLTNIPVGDKDMHLSAVLGESGLVHGYISYPLELRNPRQLNCLRCRIKRWEPDMLIYLAEPRGRIKAFRDAIFFKSCGIKRLVGVPNKKSLQDNLYRDGNCYEHEAARLTRCISNLGKAKLDDPQSWNLCLTDQEYGTAMKFLSLFEGDLKYIACSVGTKIKVKNWGQNNWRVLIENLYKRYNDYGLIFLGSKDDFEYSEKASLPWFGEKQNLCGMLTPRESAAVLKRATIFIGHDSGPMHLAASVGTPCVAIFSARDLPGIWFPYGIGHKVIYHKTECFGCGLEVCKKKGTKCIASITANEIQSAVKAVLAKS